MLTWSANCVSTTKAFRRAVPAQGNNAAVVGINNLIGPHFKIKDTKLYVPVVTLSIQNNNTLLEQLKTGFKRTIKWNKHRSKMSSRTENNNLNYLTDPTFTKVNKLFVESFENEDDRTSYFKYYTPSVEIKDFNVFTYAKSIFETPIKNKEEAYEAIT